MKISPLCLTLGLALLAPGCTDDPDPPAEMNGDSSSTGDAATGTGSTDDGDTRGSSDDGVDGSSSGDEDSSGESTGALDPGNVDFFQGVSDSFMPDGTPAGTDQILARREMVPEDSMVLETLYLIHPDGSWEQFDLVQEVDLEAQTFSSAFATAFGNLEVEGEYTSGEDWEWDGWRSTSTYVDGPSAGWYVLSEDAVADDGSHRADKTVHDDQGEVFFVIEERLDPIDQETWEMAVAELE